MDLALSISSNEIGNINSQLALISHNIANAATPDYATEDATQTSLDVGGLGDGAAENLVQRSINLETQASVFQQNGTVSNLQTQQSSLQQIDAVQGAVASGTDIGSLLGAMQNEFATLEGEPDNQTQQQAVVAAAQALTSQINTVSNAVVVQRQDAQNSIVSEVGQINTSLTALGTLSDQIMQAQADGQSTADLSNQRDAAMDQLSQLIGARFLEQPNGDLLVTTQSGLSLPIHGGSPALSTTSATLGPSLYAPGGGVPAITIGGQDVTSNLTGGQLGANIQLRDNTLPTIQANLDEFSYTLASRFQAQGLTLFSDADGNVPAGGGTPLQSSYLGFASEIQVNPAVANDPSLVRDGTNAIAGSPTGAGAFTPNPAGGPAGFTTLIQNVLDYALGSDAQPGVPQPSPNVNALGAAGNLSSGFSAPSDLSGLATAVVGAQAAQSATITTQLNSAQGLQQTLQSQLASTGSVSIDAQMSQMIVLQNSYVANARVMAAVQSMWTALTQAVQ